MNHILAGARLVFGDPRFRPYVWKPLLLSGLLFFVALALGFALVIPFFSWAGAALGVAAILGGTLGAVLYGVGIWFMGSVIFISIAFTVSAFLWEKLSFEVEQELFGGAPRPKHPQGLLMADTALRIGHATTLLCCLGILNFIVPVLPAIVIGAWLGMHDFTAPTLMRRGVFFIGQTKHVVRAKGWLPFAICAGIFSIVPLLNIVLLPALVAGGTIMICQGEGKVRRSSLG